jgi:hypothetical protein
VFHPAANRRTFTIRSLIRRRQRVLFHGVASLIRHARIVPVDRFTQSFLSYPTVG